MALFFQKFANRFVPPTGDLPHKEFSATREFPSPEAAKHFFEETKARFLRPKNWESFTSGFGASFAPFDAEGNPLSKQISVGDSLKISVPPPANTHADWVRVEALESEESDGEELVGLRVRPTDDLQKAGEETAHFFSKTATSTWILHREETTVTACYFGRGEAPNEEGESFWKQLRDKIVAFAGIVGFSDLQWKAFLEGLLHPEEDL